MRTDQIPASEPFANQPEIGNYLWSQLNCKEKKGNDSASAKLVVDVTSKMKGFLATTKREHNRLPFRILPFQVERSFEH